MMNVYKTTHIIVLDCLKFNRTFKKKNDTRSKKKRLELTESTVSEPTGSWTLWVDWHVLVARTVARTVARAVARTVVGQSHTEGHKDTQGGQSSGVHGEATKEMDKYLINSCKNAHLIATVFVFISFKIKQSLKNQFSPIRFDRFVFIN